MNGAARRTCEAGGNWNGSVPSCDIVGEYQFIPHMTYLDINSVTLPNLVP